MAGPVGPTWAPVWGNGGAQGGSHPGPRPVTGDHVTQQRLRIGGSRGSRAPVWAPAGPRGWVPQFSTYRGLRGPRRCRAPWAPPFFTFCTCARVKGVLNARAHGCGFRPGPAGPTSRGGVESVINVRDDQADAGVLEADFTAVVDFAIPPRGSVVRPEAVVRLAWRRGQSPTRIKQLIEAGRIVCDERDRVTGGGR